MAKKSSNQHKGDSFEKLVFRKLKELIESQDIPGVSRYNDIFAQTICQQSCARCYAES